MSTTSAQFFDDWVTSSPIKAQMFWKRDAERQFEKFRELAAAFDEPLTVVGTHTSKSIQLPVVAFRTRNGWFVLRDNFHGLNLCCMWDFAPSLPLAALYTERDFAWYQGILARKRGYSYKGWTDEEMADPRILRVRVTHDNGNSYWSKVRPEEKDRWAARQSSTEWFGQDWSSGKVLAIGPRDESGCFTEATKFYVAEHSFAEGISSVVPADALAPWEPGSSQFILSLGGYDETLSKMKIIAAAEPANGRP